MSNKYFLPAVLGTIALCVVVAAVTLYDSKPSFERRLYATEEVRRQFFDSNGTPLGNVQTFKRNIYRKQFVFNDKNELETFNQNGE